MKNYLLLLAITVVALSAGAQEKNEILYQTKAFNSTLKNVRISSSGGSISIIPAQPGNERVEVYISSNNSRDRLSEKEVADRLKNYYTLSVDITDNNLVAEAKVKPGIRIKDWRQALNISFRVYTPKEVTTRLNTSGGNISLSGINGRHNFTTSGGNINVDGTRGEIEGRTSGGNVYLRNAADLIHLSTSGGNIDAAGCTGKLNLSTSGGNIRIKELSGNIVVETSGGNVEATSVEGELVAQTSGGDVALLNLSCSVKASTSGGSIEAEFADPKQSVHLSTSSGSINIRLPAAKGLNLDLTADKVSSSNLQNFSGNQREGNIKGSINGGGVSIKARASSGRINLTLR